MEEIQFNLFLNTLRDEEKRLYRKYEKTYFRIISTTKAIAFNENCIREQLCPKTEYECMTLKISRSQMVEKCQYVYVDENRQKKYPSVGTITKGRYLLDF